MSWTKLDDQFHAHPKIARAWAACDASLGLHTLAMSYSGCFNTRGHIDAVFVAGKIPSAARRNKAVAALVDAGLWDVDGDGWKIHDWDVYNGDADARSASARKAANARWGNADRIAEGNADAMPNHASRAAAPASRPRPGTGAGAVGAVVVEGSREQQGSAGEHADVMSVLHAGIGPNVDHLDAAVLSLMAANPNPPRPHVDVAHDLVARFQAGQMRTDNYIGFMATLYRQRSRPPLAAVPAAVDEAEAKATAIQREFRLRMEAAADAAAKAGEAS